MTQVCWTLTTTKDGENMKKVLIGALAVIPATMAIYWWNLDNKLIFYVVRPVLNKIYDGQERDVRL